MKGFADQVHISINGFSKRVIHSELVLTQKMLEQHEFSFMWHYTASTVIKPKEQFDQINHFSGNQVIFTFKSEGGTKLMSKGMILETESLYKNGSPVGLLVRGLSQCIQLNDVKKSRFFKNQTLEEIATQLFQNEGPGEFYQPEAIKPSHTKRFEAIAQYKETNFDFLKRIAIRHGQWFYFDGMRMQLGQLKHTKIKLVNGSSLHNFNPRTVLKSQKTSLTGYDSDSAMLIRSYLDKTASGSDNSYSRMANKYQRQVAHNNNIGYGSYTTQANNSTEIEEMVKLQADANDANSIFYSGISYLPIGLGQIININDQGISMNVLIIKATHLSNGIGNYKCDFVAIPAEVTAPYYTNVETISRAEVQPAKVTDNKDEAGLGRVKVSFNWYGSPSQTESDWMRVATSYAGMGRGSYHTPEIGDEVLVDFVGGDIDSPFVANSFYNGQAKPEFFDVDNMIKGIRLRFGQMLKFIEKIGIWLSDPSGNEIHLDTESKNMTLTTPGTLTLNCKDLIINVGDNMITTIGQTATETVTLGKTVGVGGLLSTTAGNKRLYVKGNYREDIDGNFDSETKQERHETGHNGIVNNSEEDLDKNAKNIKYNSGEGTRQN